MIAPRKRILGWWFFDWASQPFNTLLLTFVFAPYMADLLGSGTSAQTVWGYGVGFAGVVIALADKFKLPLYAIGVGEGIDDLHPFRADDFAKSLMGVV